jgi:hypothetical protein
MLAVAPKQLGAHDTSTDIYGLPGCGLYSPPHKLTFYFSWPCRLHILNVQQYGMFI